MRAAELPESPQIALLKKHSMNSFYNTSQSPKGEDSKQKKPQAAKGLSVHIPTRNSSSLQEGVLDEYGIPMVDNYADSPMHKVSMQSSKLHFASYFLSVITTPLCYI